MQPLDPAALGRGAAEGARRALRALARNAAFAAALAFVGALVFHEPYGPAFLFVFAAALGLDVARAVLRRPGAQGDQGMEVASGAA